MHCISCSRLVVVLLLSFSLFSLSLSSTLAQTRSEDSSDSSSVLEKLEPVLETARESGATIVVIDPGKENAEPETSVVGIDTVIYQILLPARAELKHLIMGMGEYPNDMLLTLQSYGPSGGIIWLIYALVLIAGAVFVGGLANVMVYGWGRSHFTILAIENPGDRSEKVAYLLTRGLLKILNTTGFLFAAILTVLIFDWGHGATRNTALLALLGITAFRMLRLIFLNVIAPDVPKHRMIFMDDQDAKNLYDSLIRVLIVSISAITLCVWMASIGLNENAHKLALITAILVTSIGLSWVAWQHKASVKRAILGGAEPDEAFFAHRVFAGLWNSLAIVYFLGAGVVSVIRILLDLPNAFGLVTAPVDSIILGLAIYGFLLLVIDKIYLRLEEKAANTDLDFDLVDDEEEIRSKEQAAPIFKGLFEHAAGIVAFVCGVTYVATFWGIDFGESNSLFVRVVDVAIVLFLAHLAYQAVQTWVSRKIADEEPESEGEEEMGEEMMGQGASRLATLLPIFRNFLVVTIVSISGMIVLSEMGIDIGPLFAGAGVIGLAIGFGAQTLISDIFSGFFFLLDDAFRKGEYIDIGDVKGTVEKISIRSFQLRHHNGPLHTVPFGQITKLTNYSRDWVMMKLPLRLTYDTDVERVRKLVKKLGISLLDDPEIGPLFLQPLKSQGVYKMEDSAMIIRVKFMTKPGDQFMARKHVYARIRELFEKEGIKFAHRRVTVRVEAVNASDDEQGEMKKIPVAPSTAALAAGAVPSLEEDQQEGQEDGEGL